MLISLFKQIKDYRYIESNEIKDKLIEQSPLNADVLFREISKKANNTGREIVFKLFCNCNDNQSYGYTVRYKSSIDININCQMPINKIASVFIHELGEADYIINGLPTVDEIVNGENILGNLNGKLIETISHLHCKKLAAAYKLGEDEQPNVDFYLQNQETKFDLYTTQWQRILYITFPKLKDNPE